MCAERADPEDTSVAIMEATYRALREHGYANLTIQAIADEFAKSKSLLYYHYDTKDEILLALLEYMLDEYTVEDVIDTTQSPDDQLESFVDDFLPETLDPEDREFQHTLLELRYQALADEDYREQFTRFDHALASAVADILERGIETGVFREVNVEIHAELFVSIVTGVMMRRATTDTERAVEQARRAIRNHIRSELLVEPTE